MTERIVQRPQSQRGMASLVALMVFVVVAGLLIAAAVARNKSASRDLHRELIEKQAQWLAESAIERALFALHASPDPLAIEPQTFEERIAPVYISQDPLAVESSHDEVPQSGDEGEPIGETGKVVFSADSLRAMTAKYGFRIVPAPEELVRSLEEKTVLIYAQCEIPYRKTFISKHESRLCRWNPDSGWESLPLVYSPI